VLAVGDSVNRYSLQLGSPQALRSTLGRVDSCGNVDVVGPYLLEWHCRLRRSSNAPKHILTTDLNSRVVVRRRDEGWDLLVSVHDALGLVAATVSENC
jgi:hypothetical protein